ncbi:MAG TPA: hypothetical protein PLG15_04180 [Candidatus Gastranaerophilaceae bacterium]|nr:hypothetical protein [Candidatus Gastranaerophilaceae bacterium]HPT41564.1 hypothetical protein [Candidatus Gastranaerophilaceae bacterium]
MSKVSSIDYPAFTNGQVSINGNPVASATMSNGVINSNYNMTDAENYIYNYAQNALASILPQLNVFSPDTVNSLQSQIDAYTNQGVNTINNIYSPMIKNLQNDIASRFGNFDNSIFMDNLKSIESKRSDAVSSFAQDIMAKRNELINNELSNRYNYADFLNQIQNQTINNILSYINTALGSSSSANSYNNNLYNALYKQALAGQNSTPNLSNLSSYLANSLGINSFL